MRNLVICCDGTWNTPDQKDRGRVVPSNVVKMARAVIVDRRTLDALEADHQLIRYDTGVGTGKGLDKVFGGAFGVGLGHNIHQAYEWLAKTYRPEDKIFIFGFSRGAYTARSLSGMISTCGLTDVPGVNSAYDAYRKAHDEGGQKEAEAFKAKQRQPRVHFLGVWDTVGALGVPALTKTAPLKKAGRFLHKIVGGNKYSHGFHDTGLGENVDHAFHALAIDERRGPFEPTLWKARGDDTDPDHDHVQQAWFAGVHTNIGGGYVDAGLSDHAFMWMALHAMRAGLYLEEPYLATRVDPNAHGELRNSMSRLYRAIPNHVRMVGNGATLNEFVHASAVKRNRNQTNSYFPANAFDENNQDQDGFWRPRRNAKTDGIDIVLAMRRSEKKTGWVAAAVNGDIAVNNADLA